MPQTIFTDLEKDALGEVINIGAGNAGTALSKIVQKEVKMTVPQVYVSQIEKARENFPDKNTIVTTILFQITGDAPGLIIFIMPTSESLKLAGIMTGNHKKDFKILDDIDRSALKEVGNIIAGATVTSLSKFLNINLMHSIPDVATDTLESITNSIIAEVGQSSDSILILNVDLSIPEESIGGKLYLIFTPESTQKVLQICKTQLT